VNNSLTCKECFEHIDKDLQEIYQSGQISSWQLQSLLTCRNEGKVNFWLIDIREIYEYSELSIEGVNLLYPTSSIHEHLDELEKIKNEFIILYCRSGNRTEQILQALTRMGFTKITHLSDGIITYKGAKLKNAKLPN
jgi:rhodanese-related sulfurtransferase